MPKAVLDASALLAFMNAERGADAVAAIIGEAVMSSVNLSEVVGWLTKRKVPVETILGLPSISDLEILSFDRALSVDAGLLVKDTAPAGLSLGDRACLALARRERLPAYTADRAWSKLDIGVEVRVIR